MLDPNSWVLEDKNGLISLSKWQKTVNVMAKVFAAPAGFIVQRGPDGYQVVIASEQESNIYAAGAQIPADANIFCRKIVETGHDLYVKNAENDRYWDDNPEVRDDGFLSYYGLPLRWPSGEPFGTICVMDFNETNYRSEYLELMSELRDLVEADLGLLDQYHTITSMAMTDELTSLNNRRGFLIAAKHRLALAKRNDHCLGMLYLDMDDLKVVNDQQGHKLGDQCLKDLAQIINEVSRESDVPGRIGGDEFVVLCTCRNLMELSAFQDRLIRRIEASSISVSVGAILIDDPNISIETWMDKADKNMYLVKSNKP